MATTFITDLWVGVTVYVSIIPEVYRISIIFFSDSPFIVKALYNYFP